MYNQKFNQYPSDNFIRGVNNNMPQPMSSGMSEDALYPYEAPQGLPQDNYSFAKGGLVEKSLPAMGERLRQQGMNGDTMLAHINPMEASLLKSIGGSGTINPRTGLPQYFLGGALGAILGNMAMPGLGGILGGALGGGAQNALKGKSFGKGALTGGAIGAFLPSVAGLAGQGLSGLGATGIGGSLSNYGNTNSIMSALGMGGAGAAGLGGSGAEGVYNLGGSSAGLGGNNVFATNPAGALSAGSPISALSGVPAAGGSEAAKLGFLDKLTGNVSNLASNPMNWLGVASALGATQGRPKPDSPEKKAQKEKRYEKEKRWTKEELAEIENYLLAQRQMERRIARNQFLPEEMYDIKDRYRKTSTPEEFRNNGGNWFSYYDNPGFTGEPLRMKKGGLVPSMFIEEVTIDDMEPGRFYDGKTKGQDDKIKALLSDGEYTIPADVVAHQGDGNSNAGGEAFDKYVERVRKQKRKSGANGLPPKAKSIENYLR